MDDQTLERLMRETQMAARKRGLHPRGRGHRRLAARRWRSAGRSPFPDAVHPSTRLASYTPTIGDRVSVSGQGQLATRPGGEGVIWIKAGVPLALGLALILMFDEGESSVVVRFAFGLLWFAGRCRDRVGERP